MISMNSSFPVGALYSWNGPVCPTCHRGYLNAHECDADDLQRQIDALQRKIDSLAAKTPVKAFDPSTCPCSPSRGGSGICGCVLGSWTIT